MDTFERALSKASRRGAIEEAALWEFLAAYRQTPNPKTIDSTSPTEQKFDYKITTICDKMLLSY